MAADNGSRDKLLNCAADLFYRKGFQATSVDDLLRACGVVKSNFYYHFRSKDDLALAVIDLHEIAVRDLAANTLRDSSLTATERMTRFFGELERRQTELPHVMGCPFANFVTSLPTGSDERTERFRARIDAVFRAMEEEFRACIAAGVNAGEFRQDIAPADAAILALSALEGLMTLAKSRGDMTAYATGISALMLLMRHR